MKKTVDGYCPEQECDYTVRVTYAYVSGRAAQSHIKSGFFCEYAAIDPCHYRTKQECPIYAAAPDVL